MPGQESVLVRILSGLLGVAGALVAALFLWADADEAWSIAGPMLLLCFGFGAVAFTGRVPGARSLARLLRPNSGFQRTRGAVRSERLARSAATTPLSEDGDAPRR